MALIRYTSIKNLLARSHHPEIKKALQELLDPKEDNTFSPKWLGIQIAYQIRYREGLVHQLSSLRIPHDASQDDHTLFCSALPYFLHFNEQKLWNFSQGLRIPTIGITGHMMKESILFAIVASGDKILIQHIIDLGLIDPNTSTSMYGDTTLHKLAQHGHWDLAWELKQRYSLNLEARNLTGATPLHLLMSSGDKGLIEQLMEFKGWPNLNHQIEGCDLTYGHFVAISCELSTIITALEKGWIDPNVKSKKGSTFWHFMALRGDLHCFATLLKKYNLDYLKIKNEEGASVLDYFAQSGSTKDIYKAAILCGSTIDELIDDAVKEGRPTLLHYIANGGNPHDLMPQEKEKFKIVTDADGNTPSHYYVKFWHGGEEIPSEYNSEVKNKDGYTSQELWVLYCDWYLKNISWVHYFVIYNNIAFTSYHTKLNVTESKQFFISLGKPDKGKQKIAEDDDLPQKINMELSEEGELAFALCLNGIHGQPILKEPREKEYAGIDVSSYTGESNEDFNKMISSIEKELIQTRQEPKEEELDEELQYALVLSRQELAEKEECFSNMPPLEEEKNLPEQGSTKTYELWLEDSKHKEIEIGSYEELQKVLAQELGLSKSAPAKEEGGAKTYEPWLGGSNKEIGSYEELQYVLAKELGLSKSLPVKEEKKPPEQGGTKTSEPCKVGDSRAIFLKKPGSALEEKGSAENQNKLEKNNLG